MNLLGHFCLYRCRIGTVIVHFTFESFPLLISASSPSISLISVEAAGHPIGVDLVGDPDKRQTSGEDSCTAADLGCSVSRDIPVKSKSRSPKRVHRRELSDIRGAVIFASLYRDIEVSGIQ